MKSLANLAPDKLGFYQYLISMLTSAAILLPSQPSQPHSIDTDGLCKTVEVTRFGVGKFNLDLLGLLYSTVADAVIYE